MSYVVVVVVIATCVVTVVAVYMLVIVPASLRQVRVNLHDWRIFHQDAISAQSANERMIKLP